MVSIYTTYCIAGNFGGVKFWRITFFNAWQILIWQIGGHVSLSMYIVNEIGGFNISKWWKNRQIHQN